jgi:hypothetical protein
VQIKEHSVSASDVDTELRAIRDIVSADIFTDNIHRDGLEWEMACASMDMIGDAQLAIDAFDRKPVSEGQRLEVYGQRYLEVYGVFQAIYLQQDAIVNLAAALKLSEIKAFEDPDFKVVRDLRNRYIGHPSKHDLKKTTTYHGLSRMTVTSDEITGWTRDPRFSTKPISINASIAKQAEGATRVLGQLRHELEAKREDYIMNS